MPQVSKLRKEAERVGLVKPALIPLPDAKLRYASLPENVRREVFGLLEQSALIDGRPLTKHDLDKTKAKVPTEAIEKATKLAESKKNDRASIQQKNYEIALKRLEGFRTKVPKDQWAKYGLDDIESKARKAAQIPEGEKFASTLGEGAKLVEQKIGEFGRMAGQATGQPFGGFVSEQLGYVAATPFTINETAQFFYDPEYRAKINPQGTSAGDYTGAALKLWLNVGAPGAGRVLSPALKAAGTTLEKAGVKLVESGSLLGKPILQAKLAKEINALEFGKELVKQGVPAKEASRAAYFATKAFQQSSAEDLDLAFSRYKIEQRALPGPDTQLALPEPGPIRDALRTGTGDDIASRLQTAPEQAIPPGGYFTEPNVGTAGETPVSAGGKPGSTPGVSTKVDKHLSEAPIRGTQESTPAKTPLEPQKPVTGQPGATEGGTVSHADVDALRKEFDLPARTQGAKPDTVLFDEANAVSDPLSVARESNVSGRILEDFEQIAVAGRIQAGRKSLTEARKTFESASGDAKIAAQSKIAVIEDDLLQMADAVDRTGTKGGRTQRARQIVADTINGGWDEGGIAYRFEKIAGKPKTPDKQKIVNQAKRIEELEAKLGKAQKSADSPDFKNRIASRLKSTKPPRARLISDEARSQAVKRLRSGPRIGKQSGTTTLPQDIVDLATVIAYEIETVGSRAFDDIYKAIKKELPEVSGADINIAAQHALDMIAKKPKKVTKAANRTMSDLKKEVSANLSGDDLKKARAALSTIEKTLKDPTSTLKQMDEAWSELTKLRQKYNRGADEGLDTLVQGQVGYKSGEIADLRYEMDRVKQETYKDATRAKEKAFYESKPVIGKILHVAKIALTEPSKITRQLRSSVDVSYSLRQGVWYNVNPFYAKGNARAFKGMLKSLKTRDGYERAAYYIREHPVYQRFTESGGLLEGDLFSGVAAEEFSSKLLASLERLTLKKNVRGPVQASGEAYEMAGNLQRLESFSNIVTGMERFGKAVPEWLSKDIAEYASQATGRGQTRITELLKHISSATLEGLWSPKLVGSRFELVTGQPLIKAAGKAAVKGDWRLARVIMRDYIAFGSMMASIYGIAKANGAEVNLLNYNDPDWGKIVIGPLHIDLLGGTQQAARFMMREYDAIMRSLRKEDHDYGQDPLSLAVGEKGFVRTKLSPLHGEIANWFAFGGEDILGREVTPLSTAGNLTIPLAFGEAYGEDARAHPIESGVATALQQVGAGASVYEKDTSSTGQSLSGRAGRSGR